MSSSMRDQANLREKVRETVRAKPQVKSGETVQVTIRAKARGTARAKLQAKVQESTQANPQAKGQVNARAQVRTNTQQNAQSCARTGAHKITREKTATVDVPFSLLFTKELTPAAKLLWMRLALDEQNRHPRSQRPRRLAKCTFLARSTIYEALNRGKAKKWFVPYRDSDGTPWLKPVCPTRDRRRKAKIPVALIRAAHKLRPQAIVCFGLLQAVPGFNGIAVWFKWAELRKITGLHLRTLRRAVRELAEAKWVSLAQKNRRAPIFCRLQDADEAHIRDLSETLDKADYVGEALMCWGLSLIVDTKESLDRARPEFLANPATRVRLEFDRYYPTEQVAVEFNGRQHYRATDLYSREKVQGQRKRDRLKERICKERGITLVVVRAEDLSLHGLLGKVGNVLPLRSLRGFRKTIKFFDERCREYQEACQRGQAVVPKTAAAATG